MNKEQLRNNLKYLVDKYIEDKVVREELQVYIDNNKAKYILGEVDKKRKIDYTNPDRELIKVIYFNFC